MILLPPMPWMRQAACVTGGHDPDMWFPEREKGHGRSRQAKAVCATCPVQNDCLELALSEHIREGIWGGLGRNERAAIARARRVPKTHCRNGHPRTEPYGYQSKGGYWVCRVCKRGYLTDQKPNNGMRFDKKDVA